MIIREVFREHLATNPDYDTELGKKIADDIRARLKGATMRLVGTVRALVATDWLGGGSVGAATVQVHGASVCRREQGRGRTNRLQMPLGCRHG